jgi:surface polysaccharide O-acyltransferase-like enzyme
MIAGFIGYAVLALLFAIGDRVGGKSAFHTAVMLGASLFHHVSNPAAVAVRPSYVLAYNGAHLLVFVGFGIMGALLADLADRGRQLWYVALVFFVLVAFHAIGAAQTLSVDVRAELSAAAVWAGGILASAATGAYLVWQNPTMRRPQRWDG